jgi:hypothetical protein
MRIITFVISVPGFSDFSSHPHSPELTFSPRNPATFIAWLAHFPYFQASSECGLVLGL